MHEGAFALIDCLGWKGIWRDDAGPEKILRKVAAIRQRIAEQSGEYSGHLSKIRVQASPEVVFVSDTVVLSVPLIKAEASLEECRGLTLEVAMKTLIDLIDLYVDETPYVSMRGSLTYGEHLIQENTFLGPAIDEVAATYELANGAFVWLDSAASSILADLRQLKKTKAVEMMPKAVADLGQPMADRIMGAFERFSAYPVVIDDYPLPLKDGNRLHCPVLNPLAIHREADQREKTVARYEASFNRTTVDVLLKKQNTIEFLRKADDVTAEYLSGPIDEELLTAMGTIWGMAPRF